VIKNGGLKIFLKTENLTLKMNKKVYTLQNRFKFVFV